MDFNWTTRIVSVLLAVLLTLTAVMPVTAVESDEDKLVMLPVGDTTGLITDIDLIVIDPALKEITPYYSFIAVNDDEKKILCSYITNSYVSKDEKEAMHLFMEELWQKYPIKFVKEGSVTYRMLDNDVKNILSDEDNAMLEKIGRAAGEYLKSQYDDEGMRWGNYPHMDIIHRACKQSSVSDTDANTAKNAAMVPDQWYYCPPGVPWYLAWLIDIVFHSWYHYWDPNETFPLDGGAPSYSKYWADRAKNEIGSRYTFLGYSSHMFIDVGNPMHTGKAWDQYADLGVSHSRYETYVNTKWYEAGGFYDIMYNDDNWYSVSNPEETAKSIARYSNGYLDTLWNRVYFYPDQIYSDPAVYAITRNSILTAKRNTIGLVRYVKG